MDQAEFDALLARTRAAKNVSRGERQALTAACSADFGKPERLAALRARVFEVARSRVADTATLELLSWCEDVLRALVPPAVPARAATVHEACFSPGPECREKICSSITSARLGIDICVFTITDDRIADAILAAHGRRVPIRIVSDDEKAKDLGSDLPRLRQAGVPVVVDASPWHMHHKFAIFDRRLLLTGSYNWTRGAAEENQENLVVTSEEKLVAAFASRFDRLWNTLAP